MTASSENVSVVVIVLKWHWKIPAEVWWREHRPGAFLKVTQSWAIGFLWPAALCWNNHRPQAAGVAQVRSHLTCSPMHLCPERTKSWAPAATRREKCQSMNKWINRKNESEWNNIIPVFEEETTDVPSWWTSFLTPIHCSLLPVYLDY